MNKDFSKLPSPLRRMRWCGVAAALLVATTMGAQAQTSGLGFNSPGNDGWAWLPGTTGGYVGLNVGRPDYKTSCGLDAFNCSYPSARVHVYSGGMFNEWLGLELGYLHEGRSDRGGGSQRAEGINLSAVARLPVGAFSLYAKAGPMLGRTRVNASALSGIPTGSKTGLGAALAVGAGFDLTPSSTVVLEATRNEFRFAGRSGRQNVEALSLGYVHKF